MGDISLRGKGKAYLLNQKTPTTRKKFEEGGSIKKFEEGEDSYKADKEKIKEKISKVAGYVTGAAKDAADVIRYTNPIIVTKKIATKIIEKKKKERSKREKEKIKKLAGPVDDEAGTTSKKKGIVEKTKEFLKKEVFTTNPKTKVFKINPRSEWFKKEKKENVKKN